MLTSIATLNISHWTLLVSSIQITNLHTPVRGKLVRMDSTKLSASIKEQDCTTAISILVKHKDLVFLVSEGSLLRINNS